MKRLTIALAAAVAIVTTASAKITVQQGFETDSAGFVASDPEEDSSAAVAYAEKEMALPANNLAPYPLADETQAASFGAKYFELDTGDATVWCTNEVEAAYFDMVMQFNPSAVAPELEEGTKIAIYLNTSSNLVVISGDGSGGVATNVTAATIEPGTWARLTVASRTVNDALQFEVLTNGAPIAVAPFACLTADTTIRSVGFKGTGALDDFVARTTDPFIVDPVAKIGGEGYASLSDAMVDATNGVTVVLQKASDENVVLPEAGVVFNINGQTYGGTVSAAPGLGWTVDNGVYTADNNSASTWVGDVAGANWTDASNWSNHAVPTAATDVTIPAAKNGCTVYLGGSAVAKSLVLNGDTTLKKDSTASGYGVLTLSGNVAGSATLTLNRTGLKGASESQVTTIDCPLAFFSEANFVIDGDKESYLNVGSFIINGSLTGSGLFRCYATTTLNGATTLDGTATYTCIRLKGANSQVNGALTLNGVNAYLYCDSLPVVGNSADLEGSGVIVVKGNNLPNANLTALLRNQAKWTGTYELNGATITSVWWLGNCGNPLSKVRMNGVTTYLYNTAYSGGNHDVKLEIGVNGFTINGAYSHGSNWVFPNRLTGGGTITINTENGSTPGNKSVAFTGDCSEFGGSIVFGDNAEQTRVAFGSDYGNVAYVDKSIAVCTNAFAKVASGKTWTAPGGFYVMGTLDVTGTITRGGTEPVLYGANSTGVAKFNSLATALTTNSIDSAWTATYVVGWEPTGAFNPNEYGYADSTVALAQDLGASAYFGSGNKEPFLINTTIRLDTNVTIKNGWGRESSTGYKNYPVTFTNLTSSGNYVFTLNGGSSSSYYNRDYRIETLDKFGGSIVVPAYSSLEIGMVNVASETSLAGCIVPVSVATQSASLDGATALAVEGMESGWLVYDAPAEGQSGLYLATVRSGDKYYRTITAALADGKTTVTLLADSSESFVLPASGSMQIVPGDFEYSGTPTTAAGYKVVYDETTGTYTSVENPVSVVTVSGMTYVVNDNVYTFTAPAGHVIGSLLVNGELVAAAAGQTSYNWTKVLGASVVVAATKQLTAAEHPWYESPKGVVLAENLPVSLEFKKPSDAIISSFHGQGQEDFLGLTYATGKKAFNLFGVDGTNSITTIIDRTAAANDGFRGVAISKTLGIVLSLSYYNNGTGIMYAFPLSGGDPVVVTTSPNCAFDAAGFSPDGQYLFSNMIVGENNKSYLVKWAVSNGGTTLTKVGTVSAGARCRNIAYARINGRDIVFALTDDDPTLAGETGAWVMAVDMTDNDDTNWTMTKIVDDLPISSYGSLCVSGVNATGATPKLTVATSYIGQDFHDDLLNVYALTVPASGAVSASLIKSFDEEAMTAAGFGDISFGSLYGNTVYVTDDDATIYFARADRKLYAGQYVPKYDIKFISGEGSTTNEYSIFEGDAVTPPTAAEVVGKTFDSWTPAVVTPAAADATYTAVYTVNIYTVTVGGGQNMTLAVTTNGVDAGTSAGDYGVKYGDAVRVVYTADTGYNIAGESSYTTNLTVTASVEITAPTASATEFSITYYNADGTAFTAWKEGATVPNSFTVASAVALPDASCVSNELLGVTFEGWTNVVGGAAVTTTEGLSADLAVAAVVTVPGPATPTVNPATADTIEVTADPSAAPADVAAMVDIAAPAGYTTEEATAYKANFTKTATYDAVNGWTVKVTIAETTQNNVETSAVTALTTDVDTVTVPKGLYYKISSSGSLPIVDANPLTELSDGNPIDVSEKKPSGTSGFFKIELGAKSFE